jgi:hypothetical protein
MILNPNINKKFSLNGFKGGIVNGDVTVARNFEAQKISAQEFIDVDGDVLQPINLSIYQQYSIQVQDWQPLGVTTVVYYVPLTFQQANNIPTPIFHKIVGTGFAQLQDIELSIDIEYSTTPRLRIISSKLPSEFINLYVRTEQEPLVVTSVNGRTGDISVFEPVQELINNYSAFSTNWGFNGEYYFQNIGFLPLSSPTMDIEDYEVTSGTVNGTLFFEVLTQPEFKVIQVRSIFQQTQNFSINVTVGESYNAVLSINGRTGYVNLNDQYPLLDNNGIIPTQYLPSYVDDVLEFEQFSMLPTVGEVHKIYIITSDNKTYRWTGTQYVQISAGGVELGITSETAFRGDLGNEMYNLWGNHQLQGYLTTSSPYIESLDNRVDSLEDAIGDINTILDNINGEVV